MLPAELSNSASELKSRLTFQESPARWHVLVALVTVAATRMLSPPIGAIVPPRPESLFGATEAAFQLAVNSGTIAFLACALFGGALADLYDRRTVLLAGVAGLVVANLISMTSRSIEQFGVGFIMTGIAGAVAGALVTALLRLSFNDDERPVAIGWYYATIGAAFLCGQLILFTVDHVLGWRVTYLVPVIVGVLAFKLAWQTVPSSKATSAGRYYEIIGITAWTLVTMALIVGVVAFLTGDEADLYARLSLIIGILGAIGMAIVELKDFRPSIRRTMREFDLIGPPEEAIAAVILGGLTLNFAFYGGILLYFGYSTGIQGNGTIVASLMLVPCGLALLFTALLSGKAFSVLTVRNRTSAGLALLGIGLVGLMVASPGSDYLRVAIPLFAVGIGFSLSSTGISTVLLSMVPADLAGVTAGVSMASAGVGRMLGSVWLGLLLIFAGGIAYERALIDAGVPEDQVTQVIETTDTILRNHNLGLGTFPQNESTIRAMDQANLYRSAYTDGYRWAMLAAALVSFIGSAIVWYGLRNHAAARLESLPVAEDLEDAAAMVEKVDEETPKTSEER